MLFLLLGGIGLPGGAVYIDLKAIPDHKKRSLVSAAGPLMTLGVALLLIIPFWFISGTETLNVHHNFWAALGLLAFLQVTALILNLLPIPILDGGHLVFLGWEALRGKPVAVKHREVAQAMGLILLLALILLISYQDLLRIFAPKP